MLIFFQNNVTLMLVCISPKMSVSKLMGILKGKSSLMIFDRFAQLKYIQNQLKEDKMMDQISLKEYIDPFTGKPAEEKK